MSHHFVLTLTGPDRIGIVEEVTGLLLELGGNVETSRMARLGGEFAILLLVSLPAEQVSGLPAMADRLHAAGFQVATKETESTYAELHPGWQAYKVEVMSADHEGIIHQVAHYLSQRGISIETMDAGTSRAPVSGALLFNMTAQVVAPPEIPAQDWQDDLEDLGKDLNLEIRVAALA